MPERGAKETLLWKILLIGGCLWLLYQSLGYVVIALISLMIAAAILPLADAAQKRRVPRFATVSGVFIILIGGLTLLVALLVPVVMDQGEQLVARAPQYRQQIVSWSESVVAFTARWIGPRTVRLPQLGLTEVRPLLQELLARSLQATRGLFSGTIAALLILFVSAYVVVDSRRLAEGLLAFVPPGRRAEAARVGEIVLERMGGYVRGQLAVSACIAVLLSIGLAAIGVDTPILIGVTAGALNFVPFLGSTVALLLALLVALNNSPLSVIGVLILFGGVGFLEGKVLVPYLLGRKVALHPLAVLAALVVGAHLAGLVGALVAVPVLAGANAVVQEVYVKPMRRA
ncbi:MAG TPA: AI-2E family transporter [Candidatus Polarisedimenticolia bacterium]|nr:AI-2E family transporter [Candidatus Polarisedimenticolia bacterium]